MKYTECLLSIAKIAGREFNDIEKKQYSEVIENIVDKVKREDNTGSIEQRVREELNKVTDEMKFKALMQKRIAALNAQSHIKHVSGILSNYKGQLAEGFKAFTTESLTSSKGAKNGLINRVSSAKQNAVSTFQAKLVKAGVLDFARKGEFTDQIFMAVQELNSKTPDQKLLSTLLPESLEVAKIYSESQKAMRIRINKAGGQIRELDGRVSKRTHDPERLSKWAGREIPVNSLKHRDAWVNEMMEQLDFKQSFDDLPPAKIKEALESSYTSLVSGEHLREISLTDSGFVGPASIAKRSAKERTFHFKDKKYELEYYKKASKNANLLDDMVQEISAGAKDSAVMEHVGPNAKNNIDAIYQTLLKEANKIGDMKQLAELIATKKDFDRLHWPLLAGELNGGNTLAHIGSFVRSWEYAVKLGGAGLNALGDLPFTGLTQSYTGERNLPAYLNGIKNTFSNMLEHLTPDQKILYTNSFGIQMDVLSGLPGKFDADSSQPGVVGKFLEMVTKLNGIGWWQDKLRLGGVMAKANEWASHIGKSFNELSVGMKSFFEQFNIRESEWDLFRGTELFEDHRGRKYLTPTMVEDIPLEKFDSVPEVKKRLENIENKRLELDKLKTKNKLKEYEASIDKLKNSAREKAKQELQNKVSTMYSELGALVATEPSDIDRGFLLQGQKAGTWMGEGVRSFAMFKSFASAVARKHFGRELHGYGETRYSTPEAFKRLFTGDNPSGLNSLATFVPTSMLAGYMTQAMKDTAKMLVPLNPFADDPTTPEDDNMMTGVLASSLLQGVGLGVYTDFIFGKVETRYGQGLAEILGGPVFSDVSTILRLLQNAKTTDLDKQTDNAAKALSFLMYNIPGKNLFYTKAAFDYLIGFKMQEYLDNGVLLRNENKLEKEKGRRYRIPPSEVIPYGGF